MWKGWKYCKREQQNAQMKNKMIKSHKTRKHKKEDEEFSKYP
jgi:hypothetical protein